MNYYNSSIYCNAITAIAKQLPLQHGSILVTGATGLIGSCMVDVLCKANELGANFHVHALSRSKEKLAARFDERKVNFVAQDIGTEITVSGIDYIIHGASNADPRSYALYPVETILTNVQGAKNVLEYCKKHSARALLMSTFEVYGKLEQDVYSEDEYGLIDQNQIRSCYPESKRVAELLFRTYHDEYNVECVIARLASIYGPTMDVNDSKAHAQFFRKGLAGEDVVLKSKGTQLRTYCYLMDAVSALFCVLFNGKACEAYNVANSQSVATIADVAHAIAKETGVKVCFDLPDSIEQKGFSKPQNCVLDTAKLQSLGWQGSYTLEAGVRETVAVLKSLC